MTDLNDIINSLQARLARLECKHHLQMSPAIRKGTSPPARIGAPFEGSTEHGLQRLRHLYDHLVPQNIQPFRSAIIAHPFRDSTLMRFPFGSVFPCICVTLIHSHSTRFKCICIRCALPTSDHKFEIMYAWKDRWSNRRQNYASDSTPDYETITCTNEDNVLQNLQSLLQSQEVQYAATVTERDREASERQRASERREREEEERGARRRASHSGDDALRQLSQLTHLEQLREYLVPQISSSTGTVSMPMLVSTIAQDVFELSCPGMLVTLQTHRHAMNGYLFITLAPHTSSYEFEMFYMLRQLGPRAGEGRRIKLNCRDQRQVLYFIRDLSNA